MPIGTYLGHIGETHYLVLDGWVYTSPKPYLIRPNVGGFIGNVYMDYWVFVATEERAQLITQPEA